MPAKFCMTVDDSAVPGFSSIEGFQELLDFFRREKVPATFFAAPQAESVSLIEKRDWVDVLKEARDEGHAVELHGLTHEATEFGYPPDFILAYEDKVRERIACERDQIEAALTLEKQKEKLERAANIFEEALGMIPTGFRSPYLAIHPQTHRALKESGFIYDSSLCIDPRGWRFIVGNYDWDLPWIEGVPARPYRLESGLLEIPLHADFTWYLKNEDVDRQYALALDDLKQTDEIGGIFVPLSHVDPVTGIYQAGLKVLQRLFAYARAETDMEFRTLTEVAMEIDQEEVSNA